MKEKLVTVARFGYLHRAYLIKGWLDSAGIESCIVNHGLSYVISTQAENQIELQVKEEDVGKALDIIDTVSKKYGPEFQEPDQMISSIKNILVPIDFSKYSLNAAKYAVHVALQKNAKITLVHAYFNPVTNPLCYDNFYTFPSNVADALREIEENANDKMKDLLTNLKVYMADNQIVGIDPATKLIGGIAEEAILEFAETGQFDLIVLGSRGRALSDYWFGSFTLNIIEKAKIPVLTIPEDASFKVKNFKRLMYATDFDKSDGMAIRKLLNIARPIDVQIFVVHIDLTNENPFINYDLVHFKEKYIGALEEVDMKFDLIKNPNLVKGIEKYITEKDIDILAVTTHKRNLITSLLKPSITKELVFEINIPLLVFHSASN
jgi:nucleotide-binding universal stress UspA family protein